MIEQWANVPGFEDYQVSSYGRVKNKFNRILKTSISNDGYELVSFSSKGKQTTKSVHRLVAICFINNGKDTDLETNHIDGDKLNNFASNLELISRIDNIKHAIETGLIKIKKVVSNKGEVFSSSKEAAKYFELADGSIRHAIFSGKNAAGRKWYYLEKDYIYDLVRLQHSHFGLLYTGEPRHLNPNEKRFYATALNEEVKEYVDAEAMEDEFDALLDILVFAAGALLRHGFPVEGIEEVVRANMSKEIGTNKKRHDFELDLIKPEGWQAPNLVKYLTKGVQ